MQLGQQFLHHGRYAARIFQGAGLTEKGAAANLQVITGINVVVTLLGALLVDKAGRKVLLTIGTAGIVACLAAAGLVFHGFESQRVDVLPKVAAAVGVAETKAGTGVGTVCVQPRLSVAASRATSQRAHRERLTERLHLGWAPAPPGSLAWRLPSRP